MKKVQKPLSERKLGVAHLSVRYYGENNENARLVIAPCQYNPTPREISSIIKQVTGNCQIAAIKHFNTLVYNLPKTLYKAAIRKLIQACPKKLLLIDVTAYDNDYINAVEYLFPKNQIVLKQKYISTNESEMVMYLVKTENYRKKEVRI